MRRPKDIDPFQLFVQDWQKWVQIVDQHARRRKARHRLSEEDYYALHHTLTQSCELFGQDADGNRREFARRVATLIRPWLTLGALRAEQSFRLYEVLGRCRELQRLLLPERRFAQMEQWSATTVASAVMVAAGCMLGLWLWSNPAVSDELVRRGQNSLRALEVAVRWSSFIERFSVITVILVLVGIKLAYGVRRS